jgi:hypothetical protein
MARNDFSVEVYRSIIERSGQRVRYGFLMNGGAIVALLALLGQVWEHVSTSRFSNQHGCARFAFGWSQESLRALQTTSLYPVFIKNKGMGHAVV